MISFGAGDGCRGGICMTTSRAGPNCFALVKYWQFSLCRRCFSGHNLDGRDFAGGGVCVQLREQNQQVAQLQAAEPRQLRPLRGLGWCCPSTHPTKICVCRHEEGLRLNSNFDDSGSAGGQLTSRRPRACAATCRRVRRGCGRRTLRSICHHRLHVCRLLIVIAAQRPNCSPAPIAIAPLTGQLSSHGPECLLSQHLLPVCLQKCAALVLGPFWLMTCRTGTARLRPRTAAVHAAVPRLCCQRDYQLWLV